MLKAINIPLIPRFNFIATTAGKLDMCVVKDSNNPACLLNLNLKNEYIKAIKQKPCLKAFIGKNSKKVVLKPKNSQFMISGFKIKENIIYA